MEHGAQEKRQKYQFHNWNNVSSLKFQTQKADASLQRYSKAAEFLSRHYFLKNSEKIPYKQLPFSSSLSKKYCHS